jgi:serine/threonine protein kinase
VDGAIVIEALIQVARKRRLLGFGPSQRLGEYAQQRKISNLDDLRKWLVAGDGLSAHLANQLLALVPKPEQLPLGAYIPLAHLADGGMGTVWLACSPTNQLVVVKTLKQLGGDHLLEKSHGTEFMKRFEREARFTQQLTHPNIVRCLDSGQTENHTPFMVLEFVDSGDLKDLVERRSGLSEGIALAILYQVADGLAEANRIHLVHRDIKPPNIFVSADGRARLADFGIARSTETSRTMLTMEGAIVGSPLYMSPEQIVTDPNLDIRSDIYALGAVLYYCLASKAPFDGSLQEVLHKHCTASIPDIRKLRPVISEGTSEIIVTCMQKERGKRYADPAELRAAVANVLVKLGLTPGAPMEEGTRQGDLPNDAGSGRGTGATSITGVVDNQSLQKTIATDLSSDQELQKTITLDLRGDQELQKTIAADLRGDLSLQQTIASDLLSADSAGQAPISASDVHTIVANLLAEDAPLPQTSEVGQTRATQVGAAPSGAQRNPTLPTVVPRGGLPRQSKAPVERLEGALETAIDSPWVSLLPNVTGDPSAILLFARTKICLGRLREPPTDLCLRNYPVSAHKEACQRASRQHLNLLYDGIENRCLLEDLSSPNGTMLDGITIKPGSTCTLENEGENILIVANVMSLWLRCVLRRSEDQLSLEGAPPSDGKSVCGIDTKLGYDALIITRPENRTEMAYAMVFRTLTIGGPGSDLVCAGARSRGACQIALYAGRWIWRVVGGNAAWKPLTNGTELDLGGKRLIAQPGAFPHF